MVLDFETALANSYLKVLIPDIRDVKFSKEEYNPIYWDSKFDKYPAAVIYRTTSEGELCARFQMTDDTDFSTHTFFPFLQNYSVKVYTEKESEMISIRNSVRLNHFKNPYVQFPYGGDSDFKVGLRFLSCEIESLRSNYDEKGAKRVVSFDFQAQLVLVDSQDVPEIKSVNLNVNHAVPSLIKSVLSSINKIITKVIS